MTQENGTGCNVIIVYLITFYVSYVQGSLSLKISAQTHTHHKWSLKQFHESALFLQKVLAGAFGGHVVLGIRWKG